FYPANFPTADQGSNIRPFLSVFAADGSSVLFSTYLNSYQFAGLFGRPELSANGSSRVFVATSTNESGLAIGNVFQPNNKQSSFDLLLRAIDISNLSTSLYSLTTSIGGSGNGTVTVAPGGVFCGVNCMAYEPGTNVTVTAVPGIGSSFAGFSGGA